MFVSRKKKTLTGLKEEYSTFEGAYTPYWQSVYVDAEGQTDLTASEIEVSSHDGEFVSFYRQIQMFFATLIRDTDCKYFLNSGTFILTKLGSIVLQL